MEHPQTKTILLGALLLAGWACRSPDRAEGQPRTSSPPRATVSTPAPPSQAYPAEATMRVPVLSAEAVIRNWPATAKKAAQETIARYGQPDEITESHLVWHENRPWKRTLVSREEIAHDFPKPHKDVLEQVIDLRVPPDKADDLAAFDGSVIVERTKGEVSARCDKEAMNFLALNLAREILENRRTVEEAREFYARTAMEFMAGQRSSYTGGLMFAPARASADPDRPAADLPTKTPPVESGQSGEDRLERIKEPPVRTEEPPQPDVPPTDPDSPDKPPRA